MALFIYMYSNVNMCIGVKHKKHVNICSLSIWMTLALVVNVGYKMWNPRVVIVSP